MPYAEFYYLPCQVLQLLKLKLKVYFMNTVLLKVYKKM